MSRELRDRFEDVRAPAEDEARERAWVVAREAFVSREPRPRPRRSRRLALAAAGAALVVLLLTPPGGAVTDWVRDELGRDTVRERPRRALASLPANGQVLALAGDAAWIAGADGSKRLLGSYEDVAWSPRGRFVAATRGDRLLALTPRGLARWSLTRPEPVTAPRWSPSGFRIAYLSGAGLVKGGTVSVRVVAGDGTGDRPLRGAAFSTPPAWRPRAEHQLASVGREGRVRLDAADERRTLWATPPGEIPLELAWSADGERLIALGARSLRVFDGRGRLLHRHALPAHPVRQRSRALAFARSGHRFALVTGARRGTSEVVLLRAERDPAEPQRLLAGAGTYGDPAWSPDGDWLLVSWPSADQWLFISADDPRKVVAAAGVSEDFAARANGRRSHPRPAGWCCPP